jgi:ADP-ribose pyrophosphatase YjhB (NUDIX family)
MAKPIFVEKSKWNDRDYVGEIFEIGEEFQLSSITPITQIQSICFANENEIVIYKHVGDYFGLPGGTIETGETLEQTLKRELKEEISAELIDFKLTAYIKVYPADKPEKINYQIRAVSSVKLLNIEIDDPAEKSLERVIVNRADFIDKLNWGEKGKILYELALKRVPHLKFISS